MGVQTSNLSPIARALVRINIDQISAGPVIATMIVCQKRERSISSSEISEALTVLGVPLVALSSFFKTRLNSGKEARFFIIAIFFLKLLKPDAETKRLPAFFIAPAPDRDDWF